MTTLEKFKKIFKSQGTKLQSKCSFTKLSIGQVKRQEKKCSGARDQKYFEAML